MERHRSHSVSPYTLTLLHLEWPKLHRVLASLSAIGLNEQHIIVSQGICQLGIFPLAFTGTF